MADPSISAAGYAENIRAGELSFMEPESMMFRVGVDGVVVEGGKGG